MFINELNLLSRIELVIRYLVLSKFMEKEKKITISVDMFAQGWLLSFW